MGSKLIKYYEVIGKLQSMQGKMNLATETRLPSTKAALEVDNPDEIRKFDNAFKKITGMTLEEAEKKIKETEKK
ncbi:MAG TPA: hypothetical protein VHO03_21025 [Ignavibacteriales bacterium]|nr:hypothetical protein [Ignavibacteriales bacterium]